MGPTFARAMPYHCLAMSSRAGSLLALLPPPVGDEPVRPRVLDAVAAARVAL